MKRFIILSIILALLLPLESRACGPVFNLHNRDVFYMYRHAQNRGHLALLADYWRAYVGGLTAGQKKEAEQYETLADYFFSYDCALLLQAAKKRNDKEMLTYLEQTLIYNKVSDALKESWEYPTQEQLAQRQTALKKMSGVGKSYQGTRLKPQYALLYMRANMLLKDYRSNEIFWEKEGKHLPASVFKDMMERIYANAILQGGRWREACDIYVRHGDWESVEWAMQNYRNAAGIQAVYREDPNSPTLNYLLQYYINGGYGWEWTEVDSPANHQSRRQLMNFIQDEVLKDKKVEDKALWQAALAMLYFYDNDWKQAEKSIRRAASLKGARATHESVRCIALLISTRTRKYATNYAKYLQKEFEWLLSAAEKTQDDYFMDILERMVYRELTPQLVQSGKKNEALTLLAMVDAIHRKDSWKGNAAKNADERGCLATTWEYETQLDSLTADELLRFCHHLQSKPKDKLQAFAFSKIGFEASAFNEMLGTKYLAEGDFATAITYLEKVPTEYIKHQGIYEYASQRDFKKDRWMMRQPVEVNNKEGHPGYSEPIRNVKLDYCREMLNLESRYRLAATPSIAADNAYLLASRYYQASCYGDCWYLTHYYNSVSDSARGWEKDFAQEALRYLSEVKKDIRRDIKLKALFATAYIQYRNYSQASFYWMVDSWFGDISPSSDVYRAYNDLATFVRTNEIKDSYISRCDILREFMKPF